ncbi:MAG: hypothetical protein ABFC28_03795 [Rikenellaceae bacterium]
MKADDENDSLGYIKLKQKTDEKSKLIRLINFYLIAIIVSNKFASPLITAWSLILIRWKNEKLLLTAKNKQKN